MKHILGSCVLAGLFFFCACDDTLDTKVTWQIGDSGYPESAGTCSRRTI